MQRDPTSPMYKTCPKCGHQRGPNDPGPLTRCPACGLYFDKWLKRRFERHPRSRVDRDSRLHRSHTRSWLTALRPLLLPETTTVNGVALLVRAILWLVLLLWGATFIHADHRVLINGLPPINYSIMHSIDLVFHEAGHVIFRLLGNFMGVLGGSLMQILVPAVALYALLVRERDPFGASVALWWLAQSTLDLAPYIHDARRQAMLLLGGGTGADRPGAHDWNNLLGRMGLLDADHTLAWLVRSAGTLMMIAAIVWGGLILREQYRAWKGRHL